MKQLIRKKAFTLTELIVVIAIIGILAAVLIPSLTGYISKSKKSAAEQEAASVYQIYVAWLAEPSTEPNSTAIVTSDGTQTYPKSAITVFKAYYQSVSNNATISLTSVSYTEANGGTGFILVASNGYVVTVTVTNGNVKYDAVKPD